MARGWIFVALIACAHAPNLESTIVGLAQEMAANASNLDLKSNLKFIPETDKVVYVSNGAPMTGKEYGKELGASYAGRQRQSLKWEKWEVTPLSETAAVFVGWATITTVPRNGAPATGRYIFTMVFAKDAEGWKRVIAQKSVLDEE